MNTNRVIKSIFAAILLLIIPIGCGNDNDSICDISFEITDFRDIQWELRSFRLIGEVEPVLEGTQISISFFGDNEVTGYGGCNFFSGYYGVDNGSILVDSLITSDQQCLDPPGRTEQEERYFAAIGELCRYELASPYLHLYYQEGDGVLNYYIGSL